MVSVFANYSSVISFFSRFHSQILLLKIYTEGIDIPVAKSAWPAVFIIRPCLHSAFVCLIYSAGNISEPFIAHVSRLKAASRMHKISAETCFIHDSCLPCRFIGRKLFIPRPKRNRAVFFFYFFKKIKFINILIKLKN